MARIRTIKPEFHAHEELSTLPPETHLFAAALVNYADDEGYFNANPVLVKAGTNPLRQDDTPLSEQMSQLESVGYIVIRREGIKHYGRICKFADHQRVSHAAPSTLKSKFEELQRSAGETPEVVPNISREVPATLLPELNGIELKGREGSAHVISPDMIARGVLSELGLSGRDLVTVLEDICRSQIKLYDSPGELRDAMIAAWRDYDIAKTSLVFQKGAAKFFGDGDWRNKAGWPWKEGKQPPPSRKYVTPGVIQ